MTKPRPEMISRCVRAVRDSDAWSSFWNDEDAEALVREILREMRRPTTGMIAAPPRQDYGITPAEVVHVWESMIDAAGKE